MPQFKRYTKGQSLSALSASDMNRRAGVLEGLTRSNVFGGMAGPFGMGTSGRAISTNEPGAWFLLTSDDGGGNYTGTELRDDATTQTLIVGVPLREVNGVEGIEVDDSSGASGGRVVWAVRGDQNSSSETEWVFAWASGVFPVDMSQTGGSNGTDSTKASYTYTITGKSGQQIATGFDLDGAQSDFVRFNIGTVSAATAGLGYYQDGAFRLSWCNEQKTLGAC